MSGDGFRKCRHQLSNDCLNWTDEGLTHGTTQMWEGGVLVNYPKPVCSSCCLEIVQADVDADQ